MMFISFLISADIWWKKLEFLVSEYKRFQQIISIMVRINNINDFFFFLQSHDEL